MEEKKHFSLWIAPRVEAYNRLLSLIFNLSRRYSFPPFEPHVTLLGDLKLAQEEAFLKASELAAGLKPFKIKLAKLGCLDEYFRCLFLEAEKNEGIMNANLRAREIFGKKELLEFFPHLSLVYGNFSAKEKEKIISGINLNLPVEFDVQSLFLTNSSSEVPVERWQKLKEFKFGQPQH